MEQNHTVERIEVYSNNSTWIVDNFRYSYGYNVPKFKKLKTRQDKGHSTQFFNYINNIKDGLSPIIPIDEIINSTRASFAAIESLKNQSGLI